MPSSLSDFKCCTHRKSSVICVQAKQLQTESYPAGKQQSSAVGSGVVREADFDAVTRQLVSVRDRMHLVATDLGVHDLSDDVLVREPHHQTIFGRVVFVFLLHDQPLTSLVVGFALCRNLLFD